MHDAQLGEDATVRFRKHEADEVRRDDLQPRSRFEVHMVAYGVRLMQLGLFIPVELDDLGIKHFTVVKGHALAEGNFQGTVIEPALPGRQPRHQLARRIRLHQMLEDI